MKEITEKQIKDLTDCLLRCSSTEQPIGRHLSGVASFNIFRVLRLDQFEIRHSNMLGWLLDPNENHGLGALFLTGFLKSICNAPVLGEADKLFLSTLTDEKLRTFSVFREQDHKDIELSSREGKIVIVVENKWNAQERESTDESTGQLMTYRQVVETCEGYVGWTKLYIFLTPTGDLPSDENQDVWIPMSYRDVLAALESRSVQTALSDQTLAEQRLLVDHYIAVLKSRGDMMRHDDEVVKQCLEVYARNKSVFDLISNVVKNQDEARIQKWRDVLNKAIQEKANESNSSILVADPPNGKAPSFHTKGLNAKLPPLRSGSDSWVGSTGLYYYWFKPLKAGEGNFKMGFSLCLEFGGFSLHEASSEMEAMKKLYKVVTGDDYPLYFDGGKKDGRRTRYHQTWNWKISCPAVHDVFTPDGCLGLENAVKEAIASALHKEKELLGVCFP